jgi:hypothetical protein
MGDGPYGYPIERFEDPWVRLCSKKTLIRRRTVWRWTVEWSGVGRRESAFWLPTRALAERAGLEAWSQWLADRASTS